MLYDINSNPMEFAVAGHVIQSGVGKIGSIGTCHSK